MTKWGVNESFSYIGSILCTPGQCHEAIRDKRQLGTQNLQQDIVFAVKEAFLNVLCTSQENCLTFSCKKKCIKKHKDTLTHMPSYLLFQIKKLT